MRLGVIADIHGNLPALEAAVADMSQRRVDRVVNLGDCVSGPLWPRETLNLLRSLNWPTVRGNHDRWVGTGRPETLGPSDRFAFDALDAEDRASLRELPVMLDLGHGILAMHARPRQDDAYLLEDQQDDRLVCAAADTIRDRLSAIKASLVVTGHSHQPRHIALPLGPTVVNPGSIGCPAYDDDSTAPPHISESGSSAARYAIVETTPLGFMVELLSLPYAHETAALRAEANGRPDWALALRTGFAQRSQP